MSAETSRAIVGIDSVLPGGNFSGVLATLTDAEKHDLVKAAAQKDVELSADAKEKIIKTNVAQRDMENFVDNVEALGSRKKVFSAQVEGQTGSGKYSVNVKGGDVNFIAPIIIAVGVVIVIAILLLK